VRVVSKWLRLPLGIEGKSFQQIADFSTKRCMGRRLLEMTTVTLGNRSLSYLGIEFRVDTEFSHSVHEGGSVDT
jgi:hypothetical protein